MLTWSSWFADVGSESTDAGCASDLFSDASAAAVTCAIMKPEFTPPSSTRNGGRPDRLASISSAMRRSDSAPISAIASARLSAANATGSAWKLPPERISSLSANTSGLSDTAFASMTRIDAACRIWSTQAPITCGWQRRLYGSCTRGQSLCEARIALPVEQRPVDRRRVGLAAMAAHRVDARIERRVAAETGVERQRSGDERGRERALRGEQAGERERRRHLRAVEQREALLRVPARTGCRPARASASRAGMTRPSILASPSPISTADRCASGARSPDAPTDPCAGMHGTTPALASATSASITLQRMPEWPRASDAALSAMTRRTTASSSSGPVPAECDSTSARCSSASRASSMRVRARSPKPVLTP